MQRIIAKRFTVGQEIDTVELQIRQFGSSKDEMLPILVLRGSGRRLRDLQRRHPSNPNREVGAERDGPYRCDRALPPEPSQFPMREGSDVRAIETRAELFAAIQSLAEIVPEMRAGQLVAALGELCADLHGRGLWDASDTELFEAVWQFRRDFEAATAAPSSREA